MYKHVVAVLDRLEHDQSIQTREDAFQALSKLGLDDFGQILWAAPLMDYPRISALLPPMASADVTKSWTGSAGSVLLNQSTAFVRACSENYCRLAGASLDGKRILDFGCGYGRFLRLFARYSSDIFGVDAWEASLEHCRAAGFGTNIARSDAIPTDLPYDGKFDFAFAFSIFTHLSEVSAAACLSALRKSAKEGSILAITLRPYEFWAYAKNGSLSDRVVEAEACEGDHLSRGFAFLPHRVAAGQPEAHYGDTSMDIDWLSKSASGWQIAAVDRSLTDSFQRYVFMKAV